MPAKVTKVDGKFQVRTPKGIHAKGTSKIKAEGQRRLLEGLEHGWKPRGGK